MGLERGMQAVVTAVVFNALAFLFIAIRCVSRFCLIKQAGPEDYLIIFALITSFGLTAIIVLQKNHGLGRHSDTVSVADNETLSKLLYVSVIIYNLGLFMVKDSILYQYLRFFVQRRYRYAAWALIIFIGVVGLIMILTSAFSCWPIEYYWDKTVEGGHCVNMLAFWFSFSAFNILTDLAVWALPMPVLKSLQLPRKQKMSLIAVFALGGFGCITSILRLHALYITSISTDITYDNVDAVTWSAAELNVGIMCASIPAIRPVIGLIFPRLLSSTRRDYTSDPYPRSAAYHRHDSVVELSTVNKMRSGASQEETISLGSSNATNAIHVKQEWSVTQREEV
ncbi:50S ribosomal protein L36e [Exophiala viscosa]|uniref:50S ribosomal protein L36e n=1 Tax=Exophiala viscosa TaxID=2486360 RepID=UPI00219717C9|nr:50S ribosomal protein L36e [Exophiala viscosa]